jgi:hypothetical protein
LLGAEIDDGLDEVFAATRVQGERIIIAAAGAQAKSDEADHAEGKGDPKYGHVEMLGVPNDS